VVAEVTDFLLYYLLQSGLFMTFWNCVTLCCTWIFSPVELHIFNFYLQAVLSVEILKQTTGILLGHTVKMELLF